jgi:signal transduction histidine kinase
VNNVPSISAGRGASRGAARVLLVLGDEDETRNGLEELLRGEGLVVDLAPDGAAALRVASRFAPDVVIADLTMPVMGGVELCEHLLALDPDLPVVLVTAFGAMESVVLRRPAGAHDYLTKPLRPEAVLSSVAEAITRRAAGRAKRDASIHPGDADGELDMQFLAPGDPPSGVVVVSAVAGSQVRSRPERLAHIASELRAVDERLVIRDMRDDDLAKEQARQHAQLSADIGELRRLERQREEFTALISHDLRTPLSSILMFAYTLKQTMSKKGLVEEVRLAESIERNALRMNTMIEELTEASSLESHGVELRLAPCDLRELIAGVIERMDDGRACRIRVEAEDAGRYVVVADAALIERCLSNLLTNALKYSAEDSPVWIDLARKGADVELDVIDCGIGIAPESVEKVFDRYYRTGAGKTRAAGLGLGLYITRLIVEAHHGRIDVVSEVGKGSTFRVMMPSHVPASR